MIVATFLYLLKAREMISAIMDTKIASLTDDVVIAETTILLLGYPDESW